MNENKSIRRPLEENNTSQDEQRNQVPTTISIPVAPGPQITSGPLIYTASEVEMCIHTCNSKPCRNESHSFLWPRKQASLPRHALSGNKHRTCTHTCPGHRLLSMPVTEAMREPRTAKCRPPSEAELALAAEEARKGPLSDRTGEKEVIVEPEGGNRRGGSGEHEEIAEPVNGDASTQELAQTWERWRKNRPSLLPQKRLRPSSIDGGPKRTKKRKSRPSKS
ncbi:hypothetical protein JVU11DRAFT_4472 [Chiua virens]|nr:hypothetical protein JVU11DRAFT_4472 [Chiua virens]